MLPMLNDILFKEVADRKGSLLIHHGNTKQQIALLHCLYNFTTRCLINEYWHFFSSNNCIKRSLCPASCRCPPNVSHVVYLQIDPIRRTMLRDTLSFSLLHHSAIDLSFDSLINVYVMEYFQDFSLKNMDPPTQISHRFYSFSG